MSKKLILAALALSLCGPLHAADEGAAKKPARKPSTAAAYGPEDMLARTVFQSLLADLALQRGDTELGVSAWADLARRTRDPAVISRAVEVAATAKQYDLALELTRMWLQIEPDSTRARQTESALLVLANRIDDLVPQLAKLLEQDKANLPANLMHLNRVLGGKSDKKAVQKLVDQLAAPYPEIPEAHFAMGQAAANADDPMRAQSEFARALQLRPGWETAALARAQMLARQSPASAVDSLREFLTTYPDAREVRLTLARLLISERRFDEARIEFDRLLKDRPDDPEIIYPVAVLALQQGDTASGRALLEKLLDSSFPDKSTVHYFLGQIDEEEKKPDAALAHFRLVTAGDQYVAARARAAQILLQQGKPEEARELLHATKGGSASEQARLAIAEAQLLREAGRKDDGYAVLTAALAKHPDDPELLYETALTAERQNQPEVMEKHLRHLLKLKPDHAHALNALGYSLADRNIRLDEAYDLVTRAVALAPEDPFIMDSLGWVQFRQGKLPEALKTLEKAYAIKADPEIAAHLGEVLWTLGRKEDAARLLNEAAKKNPDNDVLAAALKKFQP
jgi:tetratricopeptide (TPR) repeat protein